MKETEVKIAGTDWISERLKSALSEFPNNRVRVQWQKTVNSQGTYSLSISTGDRDAVLRFKPEDVSNLPDSVRIQQAVLRKLEGAISFLFKGGASTRN